MTNSLLGKYLGCVLCGCKIVSDLNQLDTNCPMCLSSLALLSEIHSQDVYGILKKHGEACPKSDELSRFWERKYPPLSEG